MTKSIVQRALLLALPFIALIGCNRSCFDTLIKKPDENQINISKRITEGQLENGIKYFFMANDNPKGHCLLRLNVSVGSFHESKAELGMAHMVEHLAFDDRKISQGESLSSWLQKHGMSWGRDANAYTYTENTVYQINLPTCQEKDVVEALEILRSFADGLDFKDEAISKEKNIIDNEEREYESTNGKLAKRVVERLLSGTLHVSRPVIGKPEIREHFTKEALTAFYKKWYQANNLALVLVGDLADLKPAELLKNTFGSIKPATTPSEKPKILNPDYRHSVFIVHESEMPYVETVFAIQAKKTTKPQFSKAILKDRIAFDVAIDMLNSTYRIKAKETSDTLREPVLNGFLFKPGTFELSLSVISNPSDYEKRFGEALFALRRAAEFGFSDEEFLGTQAAFIDSIQQWVVEQPTETSSTWISRILEHINQNSFANDAKDYQAWVSPILAKLTKEDCQRALKHALASGNRYVFALGALEETNSNLAQLKTHLTKSSSLKMTKAAEERSIAFQYRIPDCSEKHIELEHNRDLDAYGLKLHNNIRALLKPTKFKQDEILFTIFANDGYGAMTQQDFTISRLAQAVLIDGGVNKHPPKDFPLLLRNVAFHANISLLSNRLQANIRTRNKDLRFSLELLRAFITDPLYAESSISRAKEQIKTGYAALEHDIWAPLQHDYLKSITEEDYRVGRAKLNDLLNIKREDLLSWHDHYIGKQNLSVVVVGDFEVGRMAQEIACVLGSMSKAIGQEKKPGRPIAWKPGIDKAYDVKTKTESSKVAVRYPLNFYEKAGHDHRLVLMKNIVEERLRLKLREKRQLTYSPQVEVVENTDSLTQNWLDVVVSVNKSESEYVRRKIKTTLEKLAKLGVGNDELVKAKEPYLAKIAKMLRNNGFWADFLVNNFSQPKNVSEKNLKADINSVNLKEINQFLGQYLAQKNASSAVVNGNDG
ncbi:MAG TPA: insulinase family protein [Myxococcota bacterium]|nr:insulinase family protein [Myxococcota bacterium]